MADMRDKIWKAASNDRRIKDLLIFITDGFPTPQFDPTAMATELKNIYNVRIMGIGVTNKVNVNTMRNVVSKPFDQNFVNITDFPQLMNSIDEIVQKSCFAIKPNTSMFKTITLFKLKKIIWIYTFLIIYMSHGFYMKSET